MGFFFELIVLTKIAKFFLKTTLFPLKNTFFFPIFFQKKFPQFNEDLPLKQSLAKILP
jgi:hypothetical protein